MPKYELMDLPEGVWTWIRRCNGVYFVDFKYEAEFLERCRLGGIA